MAFPLAHPAAVLPFRRFGPRWLNFPALVIGSLIPDASYLLKRVQLDDLAHRPAGLLVFSLPAGAIVLFLTYWGRSQLNARFPEHCQVALLSRTWRPPGSFIGIVISILIGAVTHLAWDSFTHLHGWVVERAPFLATTLASFAGHDIRLCRILWYASSFVGVALVFSAYAHAQVASGMILARSSGRIWMEALMVAALVLPIELVHDLARDRTGALLVAVLSGFLVAGAIWESQRRRTTPELNGKT